MPEQTGDDAYDAELRERLMTEATEPDLTARLIAEFESAELEEERLDAEQERAYDELVDKLDELDEDDEEDEYEEDSHDDPLHLVHLRDSLVEARGDRILEERTLENGREHWQRTQDRIVDLQERFPDLEARPEVVEIELGGLRSVSNHLWTSNERQGLVVELAKQREEHFDALLAVTKRVRSLEQSAVQEGPRRGYLRRHRSAP